MDKYEEKYKQALKNARDFHNSGSTKSILENIFPELNESEDEITKNEIIAFVEQSIHRGGGTPIPQEQENKWLEWLEKHNESTITNFEIPFGASDSELQEVSYYIPEGFYAEIKDDRVVIKKVEPKFKVGDWIVGDEGIFKISQYEDDYGYNLTDTTGCVVHFVSPDYVESNYHLWTINDAKDGDVLASGQVVFIFKVIRDAWLYCHCSAHNDGSFIAEPYDLMTYKYFSEVHPATKEQRFLLFEGMKEASYEWDAENKELKKIGHKMLNADEVIAWLVGNIIDFEDYVRTFKKDFGL